MALRGISYAAIFLAASLPAIAQTVVHLDCRPDGSVPQSGNDPIMSTAIEFSRQLSFPGSRIQPSMAFSVVHASASGRFYDRDHQYYMKDVFGGDGTITWVGQLKRSSSVSMTGVINFTDPTRPTYVERVIGNDNTERTASSVMCSSFPNAPTREIASKSFSPPLPQVTPTERPASTANPSFASIPCSGISDSAQRLACYDGRTAPPPGSSIPIPVVAPNATSAPAPTVSSGDLSPANLDEMHATYLANQMRFMRDFKGRRFTGPMKVNSVAQAVFDTSAVVVHLGPGLIGDVVCRSSDSEVVRLATTLNAGDEVVVSGTVADHSFGAIDLAGCKLSGR